MTCECGCGQETAIAPRSDPRFGWTKGQPKRFVHGHNGRIKDCVVHFWKHVDKHGPVHPILRTRCWLWTGCRDGNGYGVATFNENGEHQVLAHRFAFFIETGHWPTPNANHHCDNATCVNMAHLFEGTQLDNIQDMIAKNRHNPFGKRR
jgi:hypothetical protein